MKLSSKKHSKLTVYFISVIANLLIFLFVYSQLTQIASLNDYWSKSAENSLATATELAKVERSLGYVGFIHHFKNYIIRGDENYYHEAKKDYKAAKVSIKKLDLLMVNSQDKAPLRELSSTLDEYLSKLEFAKLNGEIATYKLDELVKVDDSKAELALIKLREAILPELKKQQVTLNKQVDTLKKTSVYLAVILIPFFIITTFLTIRLIKNLTLSFQGLSRIFEMTPDGIIYSGIGGSILKANKAAASIFGYSQDELISMKIEDLLPAAHREAHISLRKNFMSVEQKKEMGSRANKIEAIKSDGSIVEVKISISAHTVDGEMRAVCVIKDITEQKKLENHAQSDHLTGLFNRRYFDDILHKELNRHIREGSDLSLFLIDVDHFKSLNDTEGHTVGDLALQKLAEHLKSNTREYDHVCRWGGDEFAIICPRLDKKSASNHAEKLRSGFESTTFPWKEQLTLSIGIATATPIAPYTFNEIIHNADKAIYVAKNTGRNRVIHIDTINS